MNLKRQIALGEYELSLVRRDQAEIEATLLRLGVPPELLEQVKDAALETPPTGSTTGQGR